MKNCKSRKPYITLRNFFDIFSLTEGFGFFLCCSSFKSSHRGLVELKYYSCIIWFLYVIKTDKRIYNNL